MRDVFVPEPVDVAICDVRPFDRAALLALCRHEPRLTVIHAADNPGELVEALAVPRGRTVVLLGSRLVRDEGGSHLVDQLHAATPRPRVLIVDVDTDGLPQRVVDAHADGYLRRDADTAEQLDAIMGKQRSTRPGATPVVAAAESVPASSSRTPHTRRGDS